ncbi:ubiquinol-cytochrome c reductase iron-sulfur subunit [Paraburkholderia phosphatilytica]|uniref:ubiquinol-cytochrome c reductase iron-sulfur subunit n=1 Tax=Paraburkholderia phosphatilytica TaxID=2282883 RepID=UPI000E4B8657|nr:ubiquinol-cytochrome c reductase iron-sulfur subunit [Paraburkholderia phosphatilytica]
MTASFVHAYEFDEARRRWLVATSVAGSVAGIATIAPFVESLDPPASAVAAGAPVKVAIGHLEPGTMMTVAWRGKPVFVVNRTQAMLDAVQKATPMVADPDTRKPFSMPLPAYCNNPYRGREGRLALLVVVGVCTHLGCTPSPRFQPGPQANLPDDWPGGFLCPCHGSTYDLAGRVFKDKPAPQNLDVPRFMFPSAGQLVIGKDETGEA